MNFKKVITWLTTATDEAQDARKEKKKVVDVFDSDKTVGEILFRKEFLILDHVIKGSVAFKGRYLAYKDLVLTSKGIYIVGVPSVQHFDYEKVSSIVLGDVLIKLTVNSIVLYIYETGLPMGPTGYNVFTDIRITKERENDFAKIKVLLEAHGLISK